MVNIEKVRSAIGEAFPDNEIAYLVDKGHWVKDEKADWRGSYIITFSLDNGKRYYMRISPSDSDESLKEHIQIVSLLKEHELLSPNIVLTDFSRGKIEYPFYIAEYSEGVKLFALWIQVSEEEKNQIFHEMGRFLRKMHSIHSKRSGLIKTGDPYEVRYPDISPNNYMFGAELEGGSGRKALEEGYLSRENYDTVLGLWEQNMDYLKDHQPSLIHFSTLCWTLSFLRQDGHWYISRLTALGDILWWDPAANLAFIKYPPFIRISDSHWGSFLEGYGTEVDEKRINLYGLMTTICAAMGTYYEPDYLKNRYVRDDLNSDIDLIIDRIKHN